VTNERPSPGELRERFHRLHDEGFFLMPNPWDEGSARLLASLGFQALATTSSGHAASLGRVDQQVTRSELLTHCAALVKAVDLPLNVDAERCFADDPAGVAETVHMLAETGVAGCSIEDYDPAHDRIDPPNEAAERVAAAAEASRAHGMVLTARAENHFYGIDDLDDTIARLRAYRAAGADVVYAPWLVDLDAITRVAREVSAPINVLVTPHGPSIPELRAAGVRRVSTGGVLSKVAYGALLATVRNLLGEDTTNYGAGAVTGAELEAAFTDGIG
jgi:2-methylisocitrate lyase-like PEP mutase family enzyme